MAATWNAMTKVDNWREQFSAMDRDEQMLTLLGKNSYDLWVKASKPSLCAFLLRERELREQAKFTS
jgi:hypothetical protein